MYLLPIKRELGFKALISVLLRASLISGVIYSLFAIFGEAIFDALEVDFEAFRVFGGVVLVSFALSFILQGKESMIQTRGEFSRIAAEVALPFIVGAGTITLSILLGEALDPVLGVGVIAMVMATNFIIISLLAFIRKNLKYKLQVVFDKNAEIILRVNGFIVGAYGIDLVATGIKNLAAK